MFSAKSVYQEWINNLYNEDQKLGRFRRENHEQLIADFRKLDQELIHLTSSMVIEAANSRKPQDILIQAADTEANILLKEAAKKTTPNAHSHSNAKDSQPTCKTQAMPADEPHLR